MKRQQLIVYGALTWSAIYGGLGYHWWAGGGGFPFGDPRAGVGMSLFEGVTAGTMAPVIALAGTAGVLVAALARRLPSPLVAAFAWTAGAVLLFLLPDIRLMQNMAYALGGYFGLVDWPVLNQLVCILGGALWVGVALSTRRGDSRPWPWRRIGRWATAVAVLGPLPYGLQRAAWTAGIPLGVDQAYVDTLRADFAAKGLVWGQQYLLPLLCLGGALLTLGLAQRWGREFPRWVPVLGGRAVPEAMAVVPASIVSVAVTVAGLTMARALVAADAGDWATGGAGLFFLPWGLALGVATVAYHYTRGHVPVSPIAWPRPQPDMRP
ncbi:hypothetical protein [Nonomuraea typhae]|uniref:hypothetical protein n=1 Tax=Nonomuraea typhae TaxID=2603600 RepID=UPI0012FCC06B|nr:hypothetical protein [Nonomuraea typhae]